MAHVNVRRITLALFVVNVNGFSTVVPGAGLTRGSSHVIRSSQRRVPCSSITVNGRLHIPQTVQFDSLVDLDRRPPLCRKTLALFCLTIDKLPYWMKALLTPDFLTQCWPTLPKRFRNFIGTLDLTPVCMNFRVTLDFLVPACNQTLDFTQFRMTFCVNLDFLVLACSKTLNLT